MSFFALYDYLKKLYQHGVYMTSEGHLIFSTACAIFSKRYELTTVLANSDWWHIIPAALLASLLPDIDHPQSLLGQRLRWISKPIQRIFGHRGFTHSLLALIIGILFLQFKQTDNWFMTSDLLQAMVIGYSSHILADMLTPAGVPLLWPCSWRFRLPIIRSQKNNQLERFFCFFLFFCAILFP